MYAALARAFENQRRDVTVEVVEIASKGDHLARLSTSFAAGSPPDVFLVNYREYSQFVTRGAVAAIETPLADRDVDLSAYYDQPVDAFTYDGELQCMPQNVSSLVVYYNRAVFAAAGVPEPADDWTWDDFVSTARTAHRRGGPGAGFDASIIRLAPFVWSNGGDVVDDLEQPDPAHPRRAGGARGRAGRRRPGARGLGADRGGARSPGPADPLRDGQARDAAVLPARGPTAARGRRSRLRRRTAAASSRPGRRSCTPTPTASPPVATRRTRRRTSSPSRPARRGSG